MSIFRSILVKIVLVYNSILIKIGLELSLLEIIWSLYNKPQIVMRKS